MPGVPSNKACERCKKRHLKCDETRPSCLRCANAGVECPGYVQTRKFIDQGASVRRRYAPYHQEASRTPESATGGSSHAEGAGHSRPLPSKSSNEQAGDVSKSTAPSLPPPARDPMHLEVTDQSPAMDLMALDRVQSGSSKSIGRSPVTPLNPAEPFAFPGSAYTEFRQKRLSPSGEPASSGSPSQEEFQDIFSELMTGTEHEVAFLIRHFSEILAPWLDLSDSKKFFAAYVPIRAIADPYLKYAIAALAAKHLGRMKGAKLSAVSGMFTSPSTMESYPNSAQVDWFLKAANYYYLAASNMGSATSDSYTSLSSSDVLESPVEIVKQWLHRSLNNSDALKLTEEPAAATFWRKTENLLAAATILTVYKLLDEPGESWQIHLTGIRPLFDTLLQLHSVASTDNPRFSQGATAALWNFARQDYLASYYNRTPTHLDHTHLPIWRAAGIPIDDQGNLMPSSEATSQALGHEDLAANSLIWLLNKVVNFLADSKKSQWEQWASQPSPDASTPSTSTSSTRSYPTTAAWLRLCFEFQTWFEKVPETFRPCLRLDHPKDLSKLPEIVHMPFPEIFYGLTPCASTMQQFHFGRLALALNRPSDAVSGPSTAFDRLQGYRELMKEADYRCREICGIALGRPQSAARIYMIPLLFAVGQCYESPDERQIIVDLLRGIEADLGWATGSQIEKLQKPWIYFDGLESRPFPSEWSQEKEEGKQVDGHRLESLVSTLRANNAPLNPTAGECRAWAWLMNVPGRRAETYYLAWPITSAS
ncbi:hypothetical protein FE257_002840 [Aspergillus nanangensis]|uniref:Zn(2)-C6 fungal-type domain-containing protein n=1 Tax=Aspergillus nanangensis TaxID=2582783 RepID=A0AAD4CSZ3_ASPNN|nr:hypothetical protein FE257_002840 [Aspergillus nanangensis]